MLGQRLVVCLQLIFSCDSNVHFVWHVAGNVQTTVHHVDYRNKIVYGVVYGDEWFTHCNAATLFVGVAKRPSRASTGRAVRVWAFLLLCIICPYPRLACSRDRRLR